MKPPFQDDYEYDEWCEQASAEKILDDYFGDNDVEVFI